MKRACVLAVAALAILSCGAQPQPEVRSLGIADGGQLNQPIGPGPVQSVPIKGTEVRFNLSSSVTVLLIGSLTFAVASGKGYIYPNLEIDGKHGKHGDHFAETDNDSGDAAPAVSATWTRIEHLKAGPHTARLTMDTDPLTSAWVFTGQVTVIRLSS